MNKRDKYLLISIIVNFEFNLFEVAFEFIIIVDMTGAPLVVIVSIFDTFAWLFLLVWPQEQVLS